MNERQERPPRRLLRLVWLLPVLLLIAVAVNWTNIVKVARGERSLRSILYGKPEGGGPQLGGWPMPPGAGATQAKVVISVFLIPGDPCHVPTASLGYGLRMIDPQRIRVKFIDNRPGSPGAKEAQRIKLGCDQGIAINGQTKFSMPDPQNPQKKRTLYTSHHGEGLQTANLYRLLDQVLKSAYKGRGLQMTQEEFAARLNAGSKEFFAWAEAQAKARQEGAASRAKN